MGAAVVISSVVSLVAYSEAQNLFKLKTKDFILWIVAFLGTLFLGVLPGILTAVGLSLLIVIAESVRPQIHILWQIPGTTIYRSVKQETDGCFLPGVLIARIGSSLYFANSAYVKDTILEYMSDLEEVNPIRYVVLEMTPVQSIDSTALHMLHDLVHDFHSRRLKIAFCMVDSCVMITMELGKLKKDVGEHWFFKTVDDAVKYCIMHQTAVDQRITHEGDMDLVDKVHVCMGNQVGFTNDLSEDQTTVYINLTKDMPGILGQVSEIFKKNNISLVRASIDPTAELGMKHSFHVISGKSRSQLKDWEKGSLRDDLLILIKSARAPSSESIATSSVIGSNLPQELHSESSARLECMIKANSVKLDDLTELLGRRCGVEL